tara:strand:- start:1883 stop:2353 length:471 start_codon:yes stop_codon:yes gene_type:complete
MISNESLFLIFNALVGFFSDIILNIIAKYDIYKPISTLRPYFENKSTFQAAFYALLTVVIIVGIIMKIFQLFYNKYLPETKQEYIIYLILTFVVGYIGDIVIFKMNIFPKLKKYYKVVGKGLWGALAILFSVIVSLIGLYIINNFNSLNNKFFNII